MLTHRSVQFNVNLVFVVRNIASLGNIAFQLQKCWLIHSSIRELSHSYNSNKLLNKTLSKNFRYTIIFLFTVVTLATSSFCLIRYVTFLLRGVTSSLMKNHRRISFSFLFPMIRCLVCLLANFTIIHLVPFLLVERRLQTLMWVLSIVTPIFSATSTTVWCTYSFPSSITPETCIWSLLPYFSNVSAWKATVGVRDETCSQTSETSVACLAEQNPQ